MDGKFVNSQVKEFRTKLYSHLTHYYRNTLGLGQLEERLHYRETEDVIEEVRLKCLTNGISVKQRES